MSTTLQLIGIVLAGGAGALLRYGIGIVLAHAPAWGTVSANLLGSLLAGLAAGALFADPQLMALVVTGFCGGLSTYSAFATQTVELVERRERGRALATVAATLIGGLLAAGAGLALGTILRQAVTGG